MAGDQIERLAPEGHGDFRVTLRCGTELPLTRRCREQVERRLGGAPERH